MSKSVKESAREYIERGFAVCRLRPDEKNPTYKGWNLGGTSADDFRDGDNIGIIAGRLSGDLVCVDLDCDEALRLADDFLPPTGMEDGRASKPRSHRWYRVTDIPDEWVSKTASGGIGGPRLRHFKHHETKVNILDLIGTGGQAVVPPSLHPSGERRVWDSEGAPATLPMMELVEAVCRLAEACGWKPKMKQVATAKTRAAVSRAPKSVAVVADWDPAPPTGKLLRPLAERVKQGEYFVEHADLARSGAGGHDTTYRVVRYLRNDLALPEEEGRALLDRYNERLAEPGEQPWTEQELDHKWDSAAGDNPEYPYGCKAVQEPDERVTDPHRLVRAFLTDGRWIYWNGLLYQFDGRRYIEIPEREVSAMLTSHIKECFDADFEERRRRHQLRLQRYEAEQEDAYGRPPRAPAPLPVTRALVQNTLQALYGEALLPGMLTMPRWLGMPRPGNWLTFCNGLLNIDTAELQPHTSDWFSTVCLPYAFDANAACPRWLQMLAQNLEGDADRIAFLQEFFGYCLISTTDAQAGLVLVGEGGNGKSVVLAGLHAILGRDNVSSVALEDFGKRFAMVQTLGKLANICAEIGELDKTAEGTLKAFISGDPMTFERKGKDAFSAKPTARLVLSTNNVPRFCDKSEGIWRRLKLVPFNRRVPEAERVPGMDKPEWWLRQKEVPGMLNWALAGLRRLRDDNMRFAEPAICRVALEAHRQESDPCRAFLLEHYVKNDKAPAIATADLYSDYKHWCEQNGHRGVLTAQSFGKQVKRVLGLADAKTYRVPGRPKPAKAWLGLAPAVCNPVTTL